MPIIRENAPDWIEKHGSWGWILLSLLESRLFKAQISWLHRPDGCSWRRGKEIGVPAWQGREQTLPPLPKPIWLPFVLGWQETAGDTGREMGRGINQVSVGKDQLGRGEMLVSEHPTLNAGTYPRVSLICLVSWCSEDLIRAANNTLESHKLFCAWTLAPDSLSLNPSSTLTSCVILGQLLHLSVPHFPHQQNEDNNHILLLLSLSS